MIKIHNICQIDVTIGNLSCWLTCTPRPWPVCPIQSMTLSSRYQNTARLWWARSPLSTVQLSSIVLPRLTMMSPPFVSWMRAWASVTANEVLLLLLFNNLDIFSDQMQKAFHFGHMIHYGQWKLLANIHDKNVNFAEEKKIN